jgi:hypothetical protein
MRHSDGSVGERSNAPITSPLLSDEGRQFLTGALSTSEYITHARLRAEKVAQREITESTPKPKLRVWIVVGLAVILAVLVSVTRNWSNSAWIVAVSVYLALAASALAVFVTQTRRTHW